MEQVDLLVIGGGPAGYSAAIRASQLGKSVIIAEKEAVGGTCLNRGCIPTKSLLESARFYRELTTAAKHGVTLEVKDLDYTKVVEQKDVVVTRLVDGLKFLLSRRGVEIVEGEARFLSPTQVEVGDRVFQPEKVVVATGTTPVQLPGLEADGERIFNSEEMLAADTLPNSLLIVGGGVIGCEFATVFASYGVKVTIVEMQDQILPWDDREISSTLTREFKKRKISVLTKARVGKVERTADGLTVAIEQKGRERILEVDRILVSVGRKPVVPEGFPAELDGRGYIAVNESFQTSVPHIYAAGDIIGGLQLAHLAFEEGWAAVNFAYGEPARSEWFVPTCVYTQPEIGSVGLTETAARERYGEVIVAKYSLKGNGKAVIAGDDGGFCKIIASADGVVRGVHIIGPQATELISSAAVAMENGLTLAQWAQVIYPHPTVSEAVKETVLSGLGTGLHSI